MPPRKALPRLGSASSSASRASRRRTEQRAARAAGDDKVAASAATAATSSYVEPLKERVQFEREFEKASSAQRRSQSVDLAARNSDSLSRQLDSTKKKRSQLAAKNRALEEQVEQLRSEPLLADEKLGRERLRVQNLTHTVEALKRERSGLVREARLATEACEEAEGRLAGVTASLDRAIGEREQLARRLDAVSEELRAEQQAAARAAVEQQALVRSLASHKERNSEFKAEQSAAEAENQQSLSELRAQLGEAKAAAKQLQTQFDDVSTRYIVLKNREAKRKAVTRCEAGVQAEIAAPAEIATPAEPEEARAAEPAVLESLTAQVQQAAHVAVAAAGKQRALAAAKRSSAASSELIRPTSPIWWAADSTSAPTEEALRQVFAAFDTDRSGEIDSAEVRTIFAKFGHSLSSVEVRAMLELADEDGSGTVNFEEFRSIVSSNLRSELWYSAAKLQAAQAARVIQRALARRRRRKWPRCARLTVSAEKKLTTAAAKALAQHSNAAKAAGAAAAQQAAGAVAIRGTAEESRAATKIQATFRGRRGRRRVRGKRRRAVREKEDAAATKIQCVFRGKHARASVRTNRATMLRQKKLQHRKKSAPGTRRSLRSGGSDGGSSKGQKRKGNQGLAVSNAEGLFGRSVEMELNGHRKRAPDKAKPVPDAAVLAKIAALRMRRAAAAKQSSAAETTEAADENTPPV